MGCVPNFAPREFGVAGVSAGSALHLQSNARTNGIYAAPIVARNGDVRRLRRGQRWRYPTTRNPGGAPLRSWPAGTQPRRLPPGTAGTICRGSGHRQVRVRDARPPPLAIRASILIVRPHSPLEETTLCATVAGGSGGPGHRKLRGGIGRRARVRCRAPGAATGGPLFLLFRDAAPFSAVDTLNSVT
jgi:hypothetical protein